MLSVNSDKGGDDGAVVHSAPPPCVTQLPLRAFFNAAAVKIPLRSSKEFEASVPIAVSTSGIFFFFREVAVPRKESDGINRLRTARENKRGGVFGDPRGIEREEDGRSSMKE